MDNARNKVLFLMGPTASGKTSLALELVEKFPVEIVSVDSALVYRGLDIGTAKPSKSITARVPHHLIDICEPSEAYSAGQFLDDARESIADIIRRGKTPLLVGGTGLYFRSLEKGIADLPTSSPGLRARLDSEMRELGSTVMHEKLRRVDPESASRIHENDPQRIQRALEIFSLTGKTMTELLAHGRKGALAYPLVKMIICPADRKLIHERVKTRFKNMLELGLIDEVEGFYRRNDMHADMPSMRMVGYRQVWRYLEGHYNREKMEELSVVATRQLAKRQLTWLRSEENTIWFDSTDPNLHMNITKYIKSEVNFHISGSPN